jgi:hypothetical protein
VHWFLENIAQLLQGAGIVVGLLFTGLALRADLKSRHADILIRLTENHRALWIYFDERPELRRVFDTRADVSAHPVTPQEARFIQFFINHVIVTFRTGKLGLYKSPDMHELDMKEFFSRPVPRAAWNKLRRFQDRDFADYMQRIIG